MKKLFSFLSVLVFGVSMLLAQGQSIAILNHEGEEQIFNGAKALIEAHAAANHGDVITLSSGSFNFEGITKAITLRGAGMFRDSLRNTFSTSLNNSSSVKINISDENENNLLIEGILFSCNVTITNVNNANFVKCDFAEKVYMPTELQKSNTANFIHCYINKFDSYKGSNDTTADLFKFVNCYVRDISTTKNDQCYITNCIIGFSSALSLYNSFVCNSILDFAKYFGELSKTNNVFNTIAISTSNAVLKNHPNQANQVISDYTYIFKNDIGDNINKRTTFELTDEAKIKYLGLDGTQVGIYGGQFPFNPIPANPQITKCDVAPKSTADGKLSVDIEVKIIE